MPDPPLLPTNKKNIANNARPECRLKLQGNLSKHKAFPNRFLQLLCS